MERQKAKNMNKEKTMKIRTKFAIFVIAAILSIAGFGVLANALSADRILAFTTPSTTVGVSITG
jgi:hypothetical protein